MSLVHGDHLAPALHALLRGPVPQRALDWCAAAVGGRVAAVRALAGGTSSAVHADRFTAACGLGDVHRWWDLAAALGGFSDADLDALPPAHEPFVAAALARLGA